MPLPTSLGASLGVILCIDHNRDLLECEKAFLETFGYTVLTAFGVTEGLALAALHSVDSVIIDYFSPEMNAQQFVIEVRKLRPEAAIIVLSARFDVPGEALNMADAFVHKDRMGSQLLPAIAELHGCGAAVGILSYDS
jgi:DNA-binding response OmpR family regulator